MFFHKVILKLKLQHDFMTFLNEEICDLLGSKENVVKTCSDLKQTESEDSVVIDCHISFCSFLPIVTYIHLLDGFFS